MSVRCRIHKDGAITVHVHRNWLLKLLGFDDLDMEAEWSGALWCNADNGAYVGHGASAAIEREMAKLSTSKSADVYLRRYLKQ